MKRGKDDEKLVKPLFPRVHVRDTEKGWPRAPPRNKMALYEQFTVSSQKFNQRNFYPAHGNANNLQFPVQQIPPVIPVCVSGECNGQQSDAASVISSSSTYISRKQVGVEDDCAVLELENSNSGIVCCERNAENGTDCIDGEMGKTAEISRVLDEGMIPGKRSEEPIVLDNDDDDNNAVVSDAFMVDPALGRGIAVDDVVRAIGQTRFWKAKNAILNQQRLFAKQVFELHRLIKVQSLIAESPHLLLNHSASLGKSSPKRKLLAPDFAVKPLPRYVGSKDDCQKANHNHNMEGSAENTLGRSLPRPQGQNGNLPSNPLASSAMSAATDPRRCSFQQPSGRHWLIPVISASEGLIDKPYLPPPGCSSCCGGCGHSSNFASLAYGFPALPQQQRMCSLAVAYPMLGYFPPCGLPILDPATLPGSHMDQRTQSIPSGSLVHLRNLSRTESASIFQDQSSCNLPTWANVTAPEVTTTDARSMELQQRGEDTSHFPLNPRVSDDTTVAHRGRVIRAVPCNARLATESAARIFRSIQEERRQF